MIYKLAQIINGVVATVIVCNEEDTNIFPGYIRVDNLTPEPGPNWTYSNGTFAPPPPPPPAPPQTIYTKFGFRSRFTLQELVGIDNFATNTTLTADQKATLTTIIKNFDAADKIDLKNQTTIDGVNYLATAGLITTARANQILTP
jgi:hypothetical protein